MGDRHGDRNLSVMVRSGGRRGALRSLAAAGVAVLAAIGVRRGAAEDARRGGPRGAGGPGGAVHAEKKRKKAKPGPPGPTGPQGPPGPPFAIVRVFGGESAVLAAEKNSTVFSEAECPQPGQLLSCGWKYGGKPETLLNTVTDVGPAEAADPQVCTATLGRTADVATAAGQITAVALCRQ